MSRPTVLTFVPYYLPGYKSGGPIRSIANLVDRSGDAFEFKLITSDRDATDTQPYAEVESNTWTRVGKAEVYYTSPEARRLRSLQRLVRDTPHDVLYLNSVFFPDFTIKPLLLRRFGLLQDRPVVIASRGEFSEGALELKRVKKWLYLHVARYFGLYDGVVWQATSRYEEADIQRVMGDGHTIQIAPTLAPAPEPVATDFPLKPKESLRILFLSRISPMKRLDYALDVLATVEIPVEFTIVGPVRDEDYWAACREQMDALPDHVTAEYLGGVPHEQVPDLMARYDLFFLPTAGENYGHVIQEALTAGLPVLISDRTPWRNLEERNLGWDLSLEAPERFRRVIEKIGSMAPVLHQDWRGSIAKSHTLSQQADEPLQLNRRLFKTAMGEH